MSALLTEGRKAKAILIEQVEDAVRDGDDRRAILLHEALQSVEHMLATALALRPKRT
jgi:hypothetical protein